MAKLPARGNYVAFGMVKAQRRRDDRAKETDEMPSNAVTFVGNVTKDPELRFTPTGLATVTFGLAVNESYKNKQGEWEEKTSFVDVVCWREMAENVSESVIRGTRVIVTGKLAQRNWQNEAGEPRSKLQVNADEIGPSVRWATAQVVRNERRGPTESAGDSTADGAVPAEEEAPF